MSGGGPLQIDFQRYRYGKSRPKLSPAVASADVINIGAMCRLEGGIGAGNSIKMFSSIDDIGIGGPANAQAARVLSVSEFFGVASQRSLDGEVEPLRCNTRAVHEFKAASGDYPVGQKVGPATQSATQLSDDTVLPVAADNEAIGVVVEDKGTDPSSVLVEIFSELMDTGI